MTLNWPEYNKALKRRGSLTVWFDPGMNWVGAPTGSRWRQPIYSNADLQTCLTMKVLFGMALRQSTEFVESLLRLAGPDWEVLAALVADADVTVVACAAVEPQGRRKSQRKQLRDSGAYRAGLAPLQRFFCGAMMGEFGPESDILFPVGSRDVQLKNMR